MKTYKAGPFYWGRLAVLAFFTLLSFLFVFAASYSISTGNANIGPFPPGAYLIYLIFGLAWFSALGFGWFIFLKLAHTVTVQNGGAIEFRQLFKRQVLSPKEILSIETFYHEFAKLKHSRGTILLSKMMNGFGEFVSTLRASNPSIVTNV